MPGIPSGWHESSDGTKLYAPNNHFAQFGIKKFIESTSWDPSDYLLEEEQTLNPVEESNTGLGAGSAQTTRMHRVEYTNARGVFLGWLGQEYLFVKADRDAKAAALKAALDHVTQLTQEVAQLQAQGTSAPSNLADIKSKLDAATASLQTILANVQGVDTELGSDLPPNP